MDQTLLVKAGHTIVRGLDESGHSPRAALWVYAPETDTWKLWLVLDKAMVDIRRFYRLLSDIARQHRDELGDIDAGDTTLVPAEHPAIQGLRRLMRMPGLGSAVLSNNRLNGFYLPEAIVLRMDVEAKRA